VVLNKEAGRTISQSGGIKTFCGLNAKVF